MSNQSGGFVNYANVPPLIGTLVSSKLATLRELQTSYGTEDAYDLLEVVLVDIQNERIARGRHANN